MWLLLPFVFLLYIVVCFGNHTTGWRREHGFGDGACLLIFASCYVLGGVVVSFVKNPGGAVVLQASPKP